MMINRLGRGGTKRDNNLLVDDYDKILENNGKNMLN